MKTMKAMQSLCGMWLDHTIMCFSVQLLLCLGSIEPLLDMYSHLLRLSVLALSSHTFVPLCFNRDLLAVNP